jgi:hypothetical protein
MKQQRFDIEITAINKFLTLEPESEKWNLTLTGKFTYSSCGLIGSGPNIVFRGEEYDLTNVDALITIKPRKTRSEETGTPASEPWKSNDEPRDRLRIDGLKKDGYKVSQIGIFLPQVEIDRIAESNLNTHKLLFSIQWIQTDKDVRPLAEPAEDHIFSYISNANIHWISAKEGFYTPGVFLLSEPQKSQPVVIEGLKEVSFRIEELLKNFEAALIYLKRFAMLTSALLAAIILFK